MNCYWMLFVSLTASCVVTSDSWADESKPTSDRIRAAVSRALPLLEKASAGSARQRKCFTCHSQAVPVFALVESRKRGFAVDESNLKKQIDHTAAHLARGRKNYLKGKGQGGAVTTAGYALWALDVGDWKADETTAAVTQFLLEHQKDSDRWVQHSKRPPTSGSEFMTTYIALRGLDSYGTMQQKEAITARTEKVKKWILTTSPKDTEDRVFRLRALPYAGADEKLIGKAIQDLIDYQREDGGWAQLSDMQSDAYATGTVLSAVIQAGTSADHVAVRRGVDYLLETQLDDGSWHVTTRANGFQEYFETGFPHDEDQFISTSASGWSTLALLLTLPEQTKPKPGTN